LRLMNEREGESFAIFADISLRSLSQRPGATAEVTFPGFRSVLMGSGARWKCRRCLFLWVGKGVE